MATIADKPKKKMGRPPTGIGKTIGLRLYPEEEEALDAWIAKQPDPKPSRPEAIRRVLREALLQRATTLTPRCAEQARESPFSSLSQGVPVETREPS